MKRFRFIYAFRLIFDAIRAKDIKEKAKYAERQQKLLEKRSLERFDVAIYLPKHFLSEFPPPSI